MGEAVLAFISAWFSYFVILFIIMYIFIALAMKSPNPVGVAAMNYYSGCIPIIVVLAATTILAFVSKYDPLGWFWQWFGELITRTIEEDRKIL